MRGHIRKRGSTWSIVVDLGKDPITGKRKQKWYSGYKTKKEAEKELAEIITKIETGQLADAKNMTLKEYLEKWLEDYAYHNVAPTTYASYVDAVKNLSGHLGNIKLEKLKPNHYIQNQNKIAYRANESVEFWPELRKNKKSRVSPALILPFPFHSLRHVFYARVQSRRTQSQCYPY